jgi:hypothetical protein
MVTLWATGLGPVTHDDASLPVPRDLDVNLEVLVGGRPATVRYKGRSGCCAGADQINFEVPRDISGCYVPVVVRAGDVVSNFTTISVAPAGAACTDLNGITGPEIERLQNGGELRFGAITLSAVKYTEWSGEAPGYYEHATGEFFRFNWDLVRARLAIGQAPPGSCMFFPPSQIIPGIAAPTPLEAGTALNLSGPKGVQQLSRRVAGVYNHEFAAGAAQLQYLQSGTYTVDNGSGGADVGAFRAAFTIPPELKTTVQQSATGTTVSWTGGDPSGLITISGFSQTPIAPAGPRFSCTERVSAGRFAVPSYVLSSFPADAAITINAQATAFSPQTQFRAPGLDAGYIFFVTGEY